MQVRAENVWCVSLHECRNEMYVQANDTVGRGCETDRRDEL